MQNHVLDYLEATARRLPDKTAFFDDTQALSFGRLRQIVRSVGSFLHSRGVCRRPVAVYMERGVWEVAAFFGVVAGGDFYVPIDAEMPRSRIEQILRSARPPLILCDRESLPKAALLPGGAEPVLFEDVLDFPVREAALKEIYDHTIDTDPVYIVFTSGSTGAPKGVAACHRSVLDYVEQLSQTLGFSESTVFGSQTPLYFDACLKELYPTLKFGASTYLIPRERFRFPVELVESLNRRRVNTVCWVSSALAMVSALGTFETVKPETLRTVAFGSEVFPIRQLRRWREVLPEARFFNLYGPTEGTGMCCWYELDRELEEGEPVPIGRPFRNTEILLLDEQDRPAPPGEPGELCIRGASVTLGYYNDFENTERAYVQNPLNTAYPERIYRTGDLARYNERGELVFVSRKDHQIKRMGHRIELGEIEACAARVEGVGLACCVYDQERGRIALFYTGAPGEEALGAALAEALPRYMLPNRIRRLDRLPFTPNGKLDRVQLQSRAKER